MSDDSDAKAGPGHLLRLPELRQRFGLRAAFERGKLAALARFKLAGPMGADPGVMPSGDEQSHGTERTQYAPRNGNEPNATSVSVDRANMPDWLLDLFTTYDHIAPGGASDFGQEVIG